MVLSKVLSESIELTSGVWYRETEEYIFPEMLCDEEDCIIQYFTPQHAGLSRIEIRLAFNNEYFLKKTGAKIRLCIRDKNQNILQEEIVSNDEIPNWGYYVFSLDTPLKQGKTYALELQQIEGYLREGGKEYVLTYVPFIYYPEEVDERDKIRENGVCEYHGEKQEYKWDLCYVYERIDYNALIWLVISDICFVALLLVFPCCVKRFGNKKWTLFYILCFPIYEYVIVESITGNLQTIQPVYHLINIGMLYAVCFLLILFNQKLKSALFIVNIIFPILALVEYYVYKFRGRSFVLQDIISARTAGAVMKQYTYEFGCTVGAALLAVCASVYVLHALPEVIIKRFSAIRKATVMVVLIVAVCLLGNRNFMKEKGIMQLDLWNIEQNYQNNGYLYSLLGEIQFFDKNVPENYSVDEVERLRDKYSTEYDKKNKIKNVIQAENIIFIMNESWADFRNIDDEFMTVTPFIDGLSENVEKGYVQVPVLGAGTSNSEYEALTGNSMQFFLSMDNVYQLHTSADEWGIVSTLKSQGYTTAAFHPCAATNWNRNIVYPRMKFDSFYSEDDWYGNEIEYLRWCASDESCYESVMQAYQQKAENEKMFSFIVTMQNHGGYDFEGFETTVDLGYETDYPKTEQYLSLIKKSDEAFEKLVEYFEGVGQPTMIVMFGDHLPNVDDGFYEELLGGSTNEADLLTRQKLYQTPFVIWTNYDIEEQGGIKMSANYMGSYILQLAGAEVTDYDKCLLEFYDEIPIVGMGMIMDKNGDWYAREKLSKHLAEVLGDYEIVQYNRVFGGSKRIDEIFTIQP